MKASDFDVDWNSPIFNCCNDHISECDDNVVEGSKIECEHCGIQLILTRCQDGKLKWRGQ